MFGFKSKKKPAPNRIDKPYDSAAWEERMSVEFLQSVYDKAGWESAEGKWRQRSVDKLTQRIIELFDLNRKPVRVLDVACFTGDYLGRLMEKRNMSAMLDYTGVDVTPKYVKHSAERWKHVPNATFKVASALQLGFPEKSFDIVFNSGMLIHIADPETCIRGFARTARHFMLVETTVDPAMKEDIRDENKSGDSFIDRVYRPGYIEKMITDVAEIVEKTDVAYQHVVSTLYSCKPR
jgi:ubiquinone/menaquinone biosynthesis C-methylase UbiE